jgi:hypothetical protein
MEAAMATPRDRDTACLAATRALLTATFGDGKPGEAHAPGVVAGDLLRDYGGGRSVAMLACTADHLAWPLARRADTSGWAILTTAVHAQLDLADPHSALGDRRGALPEFAALVHSSHALSGATLHQWSAALFQAHDFTAIAAGVRLIHQLLSDTAAIDQAGAGPLDVLRALSLRQEAAGDGGASHNLIRA